MAIRRTNDSISLALVRSCSDVESRQQHPLYPDVMFFIETTDSVKEYGEAKMLNLE